MAVGLTSLSHFEGDIFNIISTVTLSKVLIFKLINVYSVVLLLECYVIAASSGPIPLKWFALQMHPTRRTTVAAAVDWIGGGKGHDRDRWMDGRMMLTLNAPYAGSDGDIKTHSRRTKKAEITVTSPGVLSKLRVIMVRWERGQHWRKVTQCKESPNRGPS